MDKLDVINTLDALAQESRLDIFRLLVEVGTDGLMVGKIGDALNLPHATLSFHLDKLYHANLIIREKQGRATIYRANYNALGQTIDYLTENCCRGDNTDCKTTQTNCYKG